MWRVMFKWIATFKQESKEARMFKRNAINVAQITFIEKHDFKSTSCLIKLLFKNTKMIGFWPWSTDEAEYSSPCTWQWWALPTRSRWSPRGRRKPRPRGRWSRRSWPDWSSRVHSWNKFRTIASCPYQLLMENLDVYFYPLNRTRYYDVDVSLAVDSDNY